MPAQRRGGDFLYATGSSVSDVPAYHATTVGGDFWGMG